MLAALAAAALVGLGVVPPNATAGPPAKSKYSDYLSGIRFEASGADQCDKPVSARQGNWLCLSNAPANRSSAVAGAPQDHSGTCTVAGGASWAGYNSTDADFCAGGFYGYGDTTLGMANCYFETVLNGAQARDKPVTFKSTGYVSTLEIEGDRLYLSSAHPEGKPVNSGGAFAFYTTGPVSAGDTVQWLPNGYKSYENTVKHGAVVHEWVWTNADYPGNWYLFGKSVVFHRQSSGAYFFDSTNAVPQNAVGAGYHAPE